MSDKGSTKTEGGGGAVLELRGSEATLDYRRIYNDEALKIIRGTKCKGATDEEFGALMMIAAAKRLNPLTGQIHFVARRTKNKETGKWDKDTWVPQVGIDGFRLIAVRTGEYDGQDEPELIFVEEEEIAPNGKPTGHMMRRLDCAKVRVYRKNISRAFVGVAYFDEYVQTYYDSDEKRQVPNTMWATKPRIMLPKCAEALALRKAFPEELGDLEVPEEFGDLHHETPAEKYSTAPKLPAAETQALSPKGIDWRDVMKKATTQRELDDIAARMGAERFTKKEREAHGESWKQRQAEIAGPAAPKADDKPKEPEPCRGCDRTDGGHADGCPEVTPPPTGGEK